MNKDNIINGVTALIELQLCPGTPEKSDTCATCIYRGKIACADSLKLHHKDTLRTIRGALGNRSVVEPQPVSTAVMGVCEIPEAYLYQKVTDLLLRIGIPASLTGYRYVREAVVKTIKDSEWITGITKKGYVELANTFHTTPSRVERAIRHGVERAWDVGNIEFLMELFGNVPSAAKGKPTNKEFISQLAEIVRMELSA